MTRALLGYDVLDVLRQAHRRAAGESAVGTEHVLAALVDKAAVPAGLLRGVTEVRSTVDEPPVGAPVPEVVGAVREIAHRERKAVVLTDAVEDALLDALRDAAESGAPDGPVLATAQHLGRALLRLPGTRVAELLSRNGFTPDEVRVEPVRVDKSFPLLLARADLLAGHDHPVKGAITGLFTRALGLGGALLFHLQALAGTQAVRGGRDATTPADLLLAVLVLDDLLRAHGESLKPELLPANDAAALLRSCGADARALRDLVPSGRVFMGRPFLVTPRVDGQDEDATRLSPAAERVLAAVRQRAQGGEPVGTRALVRELLDDEGREVAALLERQGVDVARLRAELA